MEIKNSGWLIHVEFFVILIAILGFAYSLNSQVSASNARIDQTNCRIDSVYNEILVIQKEIKQLYIERK